MIAAQRQRLDIEKSGLCWLAYEFYSLDYFECDEEFLTF